MRKQVFGRQLSRTKNERHALFQGLINSLIIHGEIETTAAKAKSIRAQAEKLITRAKGGTLNDRRIIFKALNKRVLVNRLVEEIAPAFKEKNGGYLRLIHAGRRKGDNAEMMKVMFSEEIGRMEKRSKKLTVNKEQSEKEQIKTISPIEPIKEKTKKEVKEEKKEKKPVKRAVSKKKPEEGK